MGALHLSFVHVIIQAVVWVHLHPQHWAQLILKVSVKIGLGLAAHILIPVVKCELLVELVVLPAFLLRLASLPFLLLFLVLLKGRSAVPIELDNKVMLLKGGQWVFLH